MGGKIDMYLDCVSLYSYFGLVHLLRNKASLASHGITIELHPVFLGGINVGTGNHRSGNKPPWTLPAKAKYSSYDSKHAKEYFGLPNIETPSFFPILSLLPQRCMISVKENFSEDKLEACFSELFPSMWERHNDLSKPVLLAETLSNCLTKSEAEQVMKAANTAEIKQKLLDKTKEAIDKGAFGCPWFIVQNDKGEEAPFFGSDRFHFIWKFLGLPDEGMTIKSNGSKL